MLDLLLAASLFVPMGDVCDIYQSWETSPVASCEVTDGSVEAGGVSLNGGKVTLDDWADVDAETLGSLVYKDVDIADEDGYYTFGGWPVCINEDGTVFEAGTGSYQPWYPGASWLNPRVWITLGFTQDPCLAPLERGVAVWAGYSSADPDSDQVSGWLDGDNTWGPLTFEASADETSVSIAILGNPCTDADNATRLACMRETYTPYMTEDMGTYVGYLRAYDTEDNLVASVVLRYLTAGNDADISKTVALADGVSIARVEWQPYAGGSIESDTSYWRYFYPEGTAGYVEYGTSDGYDVQTMLVTGGALDDIPYAPTSVGFEYADGVCTDFDCVKTYCDDIDSLDVVGYFQCLFAADAEWSDVWDSMVTGIQRWEIWQAVDYGVKMAKSVGYSFSGQEGACGVLLDGDDDLQGLTLDTCDLPMQSGVRTFMSALVWLALAFAIWRWTVVVVQDQRVPALQPSTLGEYEWGSIS
ncbi:hypothetical protein [Demequina sp. NBRC 110054]|uniref:hypothetical protein n=1 Tax=Demequina sp. NBRC 110054 TaxID=1570343 RepID=UPI00117861D1|nr:hypothetical protein [Demequina sp. NBRC 110054]